VFTQYTATWVQALWVTFLTPFTNEQLTPELWNVFNYQYARGGMTDGQVTFCVLVHLGSTYFTYAFFIFPIGILFFLAGDLVVGIVHLIVEPVVAMILLLFVWLTSISKAVRIRANPGIFNDRKSHNELSTDRLRTTGAPIRPEMPDIRHRKYDIERNDV